MVTLISTKRSLSQAAQIESSNNNNNNNNTFWAILEYIHCESSRI